MKKFRMPSWYWGNYCGQTEVGFWLDNFGNRLVKVNPNDLEPYIEEEHGWHKSDEFKKGEDIYGNRNERINK